MTDTVAQAFLTEFFTPGSFKGSIPGRISRRSYFMIDGSSCYALFNLEDRGRFFTGAGEAVYKGMIVESILEITI